MGVRGKGSGVKGGGKWGMPTPLSTSSMQVQRKTHTRHCPPLLLILKGLDKPDILHHF